MSTITVRPAAVTDLPALQALDRTDTTEFVWQFSLANDESHLGASFERVRLPRPARLLPMHSLSQLADDAALRALFILAELDEKPCGYLVLGRVHGSMAGLVSDLAVDRSLRRQGIGSALLSAARDWSAKAGIERMLVETHPKNDPAICFCRRNGLAFSGLLDQHYPGLNTALFFGVNLR
ncbi:hypothetical protein LBMAG37_08120 [Anaerolineae bacterium]|nr:hypothetical protein EMGBS3_11850 [Anaerolineaceae bacterium]GBL38213.1 hypothetical protein EMGBD1_19000 [Anaerolineaceae bacterium]GDX67658.1 hypothetical protein LBMAG37_08120 [Anaerolineae bacterium]